MSNDTETSEQERDPSPRATPPRGELVRRHDERVIAGVAAGLGDYWGISPGLIRVAFLVMTVFGGFGLLLYLGLWLIVPSDDGTESVLESAITKARDGESWLGIALITVAIVILVSSVSWIDGSLAWAIALLLVGYLLYQGTPLLPSRTTSDTRAEHRPDTTDEEAPMAETPSARPARPPRPPRPPRAKKPPTILGRLAMATALITTGILAFADAAGAAIHPRHYAGALLAVVAFALIVGAWFGRARWLILVGVLLLPVAAVARLADFDFNLAFNDVSSQTLVIDTGEELARSYSFDAADVTFDLTQLPRDEQGHLEVALDVGQITVILPDDIEAQVDAEVAIGDITLGDQSTGGLGVNQSWSFSGPGGPVSVRVDVGIGSVSAYTNDRR